MLSLSRCRDLLGPSSPLSDPEVDALRQQLYSLAELVVSAVNGRSCSPSASDVSSNIGDFEGASSFWAFHQRLSDDQQYGLGERAAILEFDAGLSREESERVALEDYRTRYQG